MTRVLEYSPSKKVIIIYFLVAGAASIFSYLIFWLLISLILLWLICKRVFKNYIVERKRKRKLKQTLDSIQRIFRG